MKLLGTFCSLALLTLVSTAKADEILLQNTNATGSQNRTPGQSFTTPDDGTADLLTGFAWLLNGIPVGSGNLYMFTSAYTGASVNLSSADAFAEAAWNATTSTYDFSLGDITLQPNTTYYVYNDTARTVSWAMSGDVYPGGEAYEANGPGVYRAFATADMDFRLTLEAEPTPEPTTAALGCFGVVAVLALRKFSQRTKTAAGR